MRLLLLLIVAAGNVYLWTDSGPVVEYIARDHHTLLGRYSVERFSGMIVFLLISVTVLYLVFGKTRGLRYRVMHILVIGISVAGSVIAAEYVLRAFAPEPLYVLNENFRIRPPHYQAEYVFHDKPLARRSYPNLAPGYASVPITLQTDTRGFRNADGIDQADVLFVGDSFTEGPEVGGDQVWTFLFSLETGVSTYNLGTSGEDPGGYVHKLRQFALQLKPHTLVLTIYEGNDFRGFESSVNQSAVKTSILRLKIKQALIDYLGPINARGPVWGAEIIDWLPMEIESGPSKAYYAFKPRNIGELYRTEQEFNNQSGWKQARLSIEEIARFGKENDLRLIVVYAPLKTHVLLPIVIKRLNANRLLEFAKLHRSKLPAESGAMIDGQQFIEQFFRNIDVQENAVKQLCAELQIEFLSLTEALRQALAEGQQVYYTYDQHWTPIGHEVVAREFATYWRNRIQ